MILLPRIPVPSPLVATLALLAFVPGLSAQSNTEFQISKIEANLVTTPSVSYSGATAKNAGPAKRWLEVEVTFGWQPRTATERYADDVSVNYYVLLANRNPAAPQGTLLTGQVSLLTIPARQNDLHTVMYVNPRTLERFFDGKIPSSTSSAVIDVGVTISKGGQVVAEKSLNSKSGAWWPQIQGTPGFLLGKPETPFAPLNADYYEPVKKNP
jgi:hypothetical protein